MPGGHLYLKLDIILVKKKNHVIRVVFQDQAMYTGTSFRGAKACKIGKKGVFLVILTNFGKDDGQIKKNVCRNAYLGSIFHAWKNTCLGCVFESLFYEDDIQLENTSAPPGRNGCGCLVHRYRV